MGQKKTLTGKVPCGGGKPLAVVGMPLVVRFLLKTALTGRPPYGNAPYGQTALREGLTGRLLTGRPLTNYRKAYGKLWGGTLPELGGNFRLCAVDQKRPFYLRVGPFLDLLPFKGPFPLAYGKLRGGTTRIGREFPLVCRRPKKTFFLRVGPFLDLLPFKRPFPLTGALTGRPPYGKASYGEASYGKTPNP